MQKISSDKTAKVIHLIFLAGIITFLLLGRNVLFVRAEKAPNGLEASSQSLPCSVTGFSQHDPLFQPDLFTASCLGNSTMDSGGCAITTLAMMLKYYGVNTTPRLLDDKLGTAACPLSSHWGDLALVDGPTSSVAFVDVQDGNLSAMSTDMANDLTAGHPVVLHLQLNSGTDHYVLAISGSGTVPGNYQIMDSSDGVRKSLQDKYDQGYSVKGMIRYSGIPACQNNLQVPLNPSATDNLSEKVIVTWDAVPNATSYEVWRHTANVWQAAKRLSKGIVNNSYEDTTGMVDKSYAYWVAACNSNGCTNFTDRTYGTRISITPPAAPADVDASDNEIEKVIVTWSPIADATRYEVWRHTSNGPSSAKLLTSNAISPFEDGTGMIGKPYVYWVKACNGDACSGFSNNNYGNSVLATPSGVDASDGTFADQVRVAYTNAAESAGYEIWRNTSNDLYGAQMIFQDNGTPFHDWNAVPGVVYYYWVRAYNDYIKSAFSDPDSGFRSILQYIYLPLVIK